MTSAPDMPFPNRSQDTEPWERFGWVMSVIWLVFLAFPIVAAWAEPWPLRIPALIAIGAFALVYTYGFIQFPKVCAPQRVRTWTLALLAAITAALSLIIGVQALSLTPFLVAFAVFNQPFTRALWLTGAALVIVAVAITVADGWGYLWFLAGMIVLVAISTGAVRWIQIRQDHHAHLQDHYQIVSERERVARDVHDVLGHSLTVIAVKSELAGRLVEIDPGRAAVEIASIEDLAREALAEIRTTVAGLRVTDLTEELHTAAATLTTAGIAHALPADPDPLAPEHHLVAAWVLRETVTNVVRHAGATRCDVTFEEGALLVTDDGRGVGPATPGSGLRGARERAEATGGTLIVSERPSGGTRIELRW